MTRTRKSRGRIELALAATMGLIVASCGAADRSTVPSQVAGVQATVPASASPAPTVPASATPRPTGPTSTSPAPTSLPRIALPVEPGASVEGLVDVGGHDIYARCAGEGSPTVVYFTGWANHELRATTIAEGVERALGSDIRVCSYDRRNMGRSEVVGGTQTPEDVIADVDGVLAALGEEGPYVLLGASFGGIVASAYAVAHPDRVAGVVLLDASTGAEYEIEETHDLSGACLAANREADAWNSIEKLDNCALYEWVHERLDQEPDVPLLYLASQNGSTRGSADDAARIAWVESWSPGEWREVSAPHWMDVADTALVAAAVHEVIGGLR